MLYFSFICRLMALNMLLTNGSTSLVLLLFDMVLISLNLIIFCSQKGQVLHFLPYWYMLMMLLSPILMKLL